MPTSPTSPRRNGQFSALIALLLSPIGFAEGYQLEAVYTGEFRSNVSGGIETGGPRNRPGHS